MNSRITRSIQFYSVTSFISLKNSCRLSWLRIRLVLSLNFPAVCISGLSAVKLLNYRSVWLCVVGSLFNISTFQISKEASGVFWSFWFPFQCDCSQNDSWKKSPSWGIFIPHFPKTKNSKGPSWQLLKNWICVKFLFT